MPRKLTSKQELYKNYRIMGKGLKEAYCAAYDAKRMSDNSINKAAYELDNHPMIAPYIEKAKEIATERALVTVEDVVKGLLKETGESVEGGTHGGRVSAWKHLAEYTGGFDSNTRKIEHSGTIETLSDEQLNAKLEALIAITK